MLFCEHVMATRAVEFECGESIGSCGLVDIISFAVVPSALFGRRKRGMSALSALERGDREKGLAERLSTARPIRPVSRSFEQLTTRLNSQCRISNCRRLRLVMLFLFIRPSARRLSSLRRLALPSFDGRASSFHMHS